MTSRAERVSLKMFEDSLLAPDLQHESMIAEYFWQANPEHLVTQGDVAAVQALNADKTRFLIRYLKEFWVEL